MTLWLFRYVTLFLLIMLQEIIQNCRCFMNRMGFLLELRMLNGKKIDNVIEDV